jgi:hypothetical protein
MLRTSGLGSPGMGQARLQPLCILPTLRPADATAPKAGRLTSVGTADRAFHPAELRSAQSQGMKTPKIVLRYPELALPAALQNWVWPLTPPRWP